MGDLPEFGSLHDWRDLTDVPWESLLLGNGLSINVSPRFDYESLYAEADFKGGLSAEDRSIFEVVDSRNFEVALAKLRDAIVLAEALELDPNPYKRHFRSIQTALGQTIRKVHLSGREVPITTLAAIQQAFLGHKRVFTTSYDLLAYWAISHEHGYKRFCDCFWAHERNEFDPDNCTVKSLKPIYYLHGALHLVVGGSGTARKLTRGDLRHGEAQILDRFGKTDSKDPEARPLLVSEGSSRDKLRVIEGNDYLAHVYEQFKQDAKPLVIFGHSLGEQDQHLIEAIASIPGRPVAISMLAKSEERLRAEQVRIWNLLQKQRIYFYDAATHPLGKPQLRITAGLGRPVTSKHRMGRALRRG